MGLRLASAAVVSATVVLVAACGGGGADDAVDERADASADAADGEAAAEPGQDTELGSGVTESAPEPVEEPVEPDDPADLIIHGGAIITVDADRRVVEAVAVDEGRFAAVGTDDEVMALTGPETRVVDLEGRTVMPGIVDPHVHYIQNQSPDLVPMLDDQRILLENGRTTVGIPAVIPINMEGFDAIAAADAAVLRMHLYVSYNSSCGDLEGEGWREFEFDRSADQRIAIAGVKVFTDGGACNAPAVSWEYPETPEAEALDVFPGSGDLYVTVEELAAVVADTEARGGLTLIHAIGDVGIATALDGLEAGLAGAENVNGHRIDHNVVIPPELYPRYGELGVIPVVWGNYASCREEDGLGWAAITPTDKLPWLRATPDLMAADPSLPVAFHSDVPFGWLNMFEQLWGLVTLREREADSGRICDPPEFLEGHQVSIPTAIEMMTVNAAHAMDLEREVGSIEVGKVADMVVIANNPLSQSGDDLLDNRVVATLIDGEAAFCAQEWESACDEIGRVENGRVEIGRVENGGAGEDGAAPGDGDGAMSVKGVAIASVRASGVDPSWPIEAVTDGVTDEGGWVSAGSAPQWIELDLGEESAVETLVLWVDQFPDGITEHVIYGGLAPDPTTELARLEGETRWGQRLEVEIGVSVRYLRVETVSSPSWVAWLEIAVVTAETGE